MIIMMIMIMIIIRIPTIKKRCTRPGFPYEGRVKALAEAARSAGLQSGPQPAHHGRYWVIGSPPSVSRDFLLV